MRIHEIIVTHTRHKILQILTRQCNLHSFHSYVLRSSETPATHHPFICEWHSDTSPVDSASGSCSLSTTCFTSISTAGGMVMMQPCGSVSNSAITSHCAPARRLNDPRSRRHGFVDFPAGRLEFNLWGECDLLAALFLVEFRLSENTPDRDCVADEIDYGSRELQRWRSTGFSRGEEPNHDRHTQYRRQPEISGKGYFYANVSERLTRRKHGRLSSEASPNIATSCAPSFRNRCCGKRFSRSAETFCLTARNTTASTTA